FCRSWRRSPPAPRSQSTAAPRPWRRRSCSHWSRSSRSPARRAARRGCGRCPSVSEGWGQVLAIDELTYRYPGAERDALERVSVAVDAGELVVLAGRSGSGKSTLLRAASGLVPHFHGGEVSGRVEVAGLDVRDHGPGGLARSGGLVAQDPELG